MYRLIKSNWGKGYDELEPFAVVLEADLLEAVNNPDLNLTWIVQALAHNCTIETLNDAEGQTYIHFGVDHVKGMKALGDYLKAHGAVPIA